MDGSAGRVDPRAPRPPGRATAAFMRSVVAFSGFGEIGNPGRYVPLPEGWSVGVADVVASTDAIAAGRYKAVNTAGAAVISAVSNALGTLDFPFIFAGDGAGFAVAPQDAPAAAQTLAATVAWARDALDLRLRAAMIPVATIRAAGHDVRVARFQASSDAAYAMFAGGGLTWAEERLKADLEVLPPAPPGVHPDLSGLSCRFRYIPARNGVILSMLVRPLRPDDDRFRALIAELLAIAEDGPDVHRPDFGGASGVNLAALPLNAQVMAAGGASRLASFARTARDFLVAAAVLGTGARIGRFSARRYLREVAANSDFRKYEDGLMMTLDCSAAVADGLAERLEAAVGERIATYGLHRQSAATVTCVVPSASDPGHVHFIDGAAGGYAMAAGAMKSRLASAG